MCRTWSVGEFRVARPSARTTSLIADLSMKGRQTIPPATGDEIGSRESGLDGHGGPQLTHGSRRMEDEEGALVVDG